MTHEKPYAPACDKNKDPILRILREQFTHPGRVLEIGSGTGQHAVHFAEHLPHLEWQPTDLAENLPGIRAWCESVRLPNLKAPVELDVTRLDWDAFEADYIFSANAVHIMSWDAVLAFFSGIERSLNPRGLLGLYGPFNYRGRYTSESNAHFDLWLKERDPLSGIRNFEDLDRLATSAGLHLFKDHEMPANNRTLIWARSSACYGI
ncbi:MAG: class I SAM-dependent methyltransferase [Methylococcaceae bacterium]|nr:class I SAM-dependent methyltransferase [Methylococcaceae bacterium]